MNARTPFLLAVAVATAVMVACTTVPPEAPELSAELGNRLDAIEEAHLALLHKYMAERRERVDRFVNETFIPRFAENVFAKPAVRREWERIAAGDDAEERLRFIIGLSTRLQQEIQRKRREFLAPLEELEARLARALEKEYARAKAINNSVTSFLATASELEQSRSRFMESFSVTESDLGRALDRIDQAVDDVVAARDDAAAFRERLEEVRESLP